MTNFDPKEYWNNRLQENYNLSGVGYSGLGINFNKWAYKVRKVSFKKLISKNNTDASKISVLDVGSGTGFYINCWKELKVRKITGSDITEVAVSNLKNNFQDCKIIQFDISGKIPEEIKSEQFDIISIMDVLFHVVDNKNFEQAIKNVYALLKPGGYFVFSDSFLHNNSIIIDHCVSRTLWDIEKVVIQEGFKIVLRKPIFMFMNNPADSKNVFLKYLWKLIVKIVKLGEIPAYIVGMILYPIELIMISIKKEGPSTEIMLCKKTN